MKILKPGKVEKMKYTCPQCGCVFVATPSDREYALPDTVACPQGGCDGIMPWDIGEPYEEPTSTQTDRERLTALMLDSDSAEEMDELVDRLI